MRGDVQYYLRAHIPAPLFLASLPHIPSSLAAVLATSLVASAMESPAKKRAPAMRTGGTPLLRTSGVLKNTAMAPRSLIFAARSGRWRTGMDTRERVSAVCAR